MNKISDLFKKKEVLVCRPCAEKLKAEGKLKMGSSVKEKETCEICNRRRFVYKCTYGK